jgi:hypothetical protein
MPWGRKFCWIGLAAAGAFTGGAGGAWAQSDDALLAANRELSVGAIGFHRSYKEFYAPGSVGYDRESGWTAGGQASASWMGRLGPLPRAFAAVEGDAERGALTYRGTEFNSTIPLTFASGLTNARLRAEIGEGFRLGERVLVTPMLEGGYLWWRRDLGPGQVEDYAAGFVGAGVRADVALAPRLVARGRLAAATTVSPGVTLNYAQSYAAPLGERPLYEASLGLHYAATRRMRLYASAEAERYGFGQSPTISTVERGRVYEPTSHTTDLRIGAGLAYGF